jgi:hypothetical protein
MYIIAVYHYYIMELEIKILYFLFGLFFGSTIGAYIVHILYLRMVSGISKDMNDIIDKVDLRISTVLNPEVLVSEIKKYIIGMLINRQP